MQFCKTAAELVTRKPSLFKLKNMLAWCLIDCLCRGADGRTLCQSLTSQAGVGVLGFQGVETNESG